MTTRFVAISFAWLAACSTDSQNLDDPQLPPEGAADVSAWLAKGFYKAWRCEPAGHAARDPSPHGRNRICNNDAIKNASPTGAYPVGAASAKELLDDTDAIVGYAVYRKLADGSDGSNWYWFEMTSGNTIDGTGVDVCVGCHSHAPRDFVFTAVP